MCIRDRGFLTEAIVNFVALLGWSPSDNQEIMSLPELVEKFDYCLLYTSLRSKGMVEGTDGKWIYFDMVPGEYEIRDGEPDYTGPVSYTHLPFYV